jgi:glycopeptide antibiotics resistance protein
MKVKGWRLYLGMAGILYGGFLLYLLFFASFRDGTEASINFIPFKSIVQFCLDIRWHTIPHWMVNVPGNVIAFIPFPIVAALWGLKTNKLLSKILIASLIPMVVEGIQYVTDVGHANIDDVVLNSIGFAIGFQIVARQPKLSPPRS